MNELAAVTLALSIVTILAGVLDRSGRSPVVGLLAVSSYGCAIALCVVVLW